MRNHTIFKLRYYLHVNQNKAGNPIVVTQFLKIIGCLFAIFVVTGIATFGIRLCDRVREVQIVFYNSIIYYLIYKSKHLILSILTISNFSIRSIRERERADCQHQPPCYDALMLTESIYYRVMMSLVDCQHWHYSENAYMPATLGNTRNTSIEGVVGFTSGRAIHNNNDIRGLTT